MREFAFIIMYLPIISFFFIYKRKDLLAPENIFTGIYLISILVPTLLNYSARNYSELTNKFLRNAVADDIYYFKYSILQTISYYCVLLGIKLKLANKSSYNIVLKKVNRHIKPQNRIKEYKITGIIFIVIGLFSFIFIMKSVGGIVYFFSHLNLRTILLRGLTWSVWLLPLLQYGVLLLVYYTYKKQGRINILLGLLILFAGIMCGLGGRKALVFLIIKIVFIYNYSIKKISVRKLINLKTISLLIFIVIFFNILVAIRNPEKVMLLLENPEFFLSSSSRNIIEVISDESYISFYIFSIKYFDTHDLWWGASFRGLLTAIIPSAIYINKPPVDDGMYLYSICQGRESIIPPMSVKELNGSSYPLETFVSMYANFGLIGLFIGMFLLGVILQKIYYKMERSNYSLKWILLYCAIVIEFQLSTLRIFQFFIAYILLTGIDIFIKVIRRRIYKHKKYIT